MLYKYHLNSLESAFNFTLKYTQGRLNTLISTLNYPQFYAPPFHTPIIIHLNPPSAHDVVCALDQAGEGERRTIASAHAARRPEQRVAREDGRFLVESSHELPFTSPLQSDRLHPGLVAPLGTWVHRHLNPLEILSSHPYLCPHLITLEYSLFTPRSHLRSNCHSNHYANRHSNRHSNRRLNCHPKTIEFTFHYSRLFTFHSSLESALESSLDYS